MIVKYTQRLFMLAIMVLAGTSASAQQAGRLKIDDQRYIFLGKDDASLHLVWEEHPAFPIRWYVIEKSYDDFRYFPVDSIEPVNLFDIHANGYPKDINYYNTILYNTETGGGRFIYNDVRGVDEAAEKNFWYRIKMVKANGDKIYTTSAHQNFSYGIADIERLRQIGNENDLGNEGNPKTGGQGADGGGTIAFRRGSGPCPELGTPPTGYIFSGNTRTFYGDCCYWEEREYIASQVTQACGTQQSWCCPRDCNPLASDPCCVHVCSEYNQCSCHPWICCPVTDYTVWVVSSSVDYVVSANIVPQNISCNGRTDGVLTVTAANGISPYTYNWSTGGTAASIQGLGVGSYTVTVTDDNDCTTSATGAITQPAPLAVTLTPDHASCFGFTDGSLTPTVTGGTPHYTYSWSNGESVPTATVLGAGAHTVTVTDVNGCILSATGTITEPPPLTSSLSFENVSCFGFNDGNVDLTVSGGSPAYTYSWNNGPNPTSEDQSGLGPGNYSVTVTDAQGCLTAAFANILEPDLFVGTVSVTDILCNGWQTGTAVFNMTGGSGSYATVWSTGTTSHVLSHVFAGTYTVTVTDGNGCSFTGTATINEPPPIVVSATSTNATCGLCDGTSTASATGGFGSYIWNWATVPAQSTPTATGLCAGITFLNVGDAAEPACITSYPVSVNNNNAQPITASSTNASCPTACDGSASVTLTGGCAIPPCDIAWFDPNGAQINNQFSQTLQNICPGNYLVRVTNGQGCISSQTVEVTAPSDISITLNVTHQTCSSTCNGSASVNPPTGGTPPYTYQWRDSTGTPLPFQTNPSVSNLCPGSYSVRVLDFGGCTIIEDFVVLGYDFSVITTQTNATCNGACDGSITAEVTGGSTPFTYQWLDASNNPIPGETNRSIFNVCAGTYSVQVTSSTNCVVTSPTAIITEPPADNASISNTNILCMGQCTGTATVVASGANGPYTYQWLDVNGNMIPGEVNATISNLCAGTYSAQVISAFGCVYVAGPVVVTEPTPVTASTTKTDIICTGQCTGAAMVTGSGGTPPYSYQWYDNFNVPIAGEANDTILNLCEAVYFVIVTDANGCQTLAQQVDIVPLSEITLSFTSLDISCTDANDGTIDLTVNGAAAPVTYSWNNGAYSTEDLTGLAAGVYTVVVTDVAGCTATGNETIVNPAPLVAHATIHPYPGGHVSCHDFTNGRATVIATGGTGPYEYFWSDPDSQDTETAINLPLGTYIAAVIDVRGCFDTTTVRLHLNPPPILTNIDVTHILCHGDSTGALDLTVVNGRPPLVYEWLPVHIVFQEDLYNVVADTYIVVVTDTVNGCSVRDTAIVNQPPPILTNLQLGTCRDSFFVGGAYQTQDGTYYDTLTAANTCDSVVITDLQFVTSFFVQDTVNICDGGSYFVGGALQTTAGIYYDTLIAAGNCDSIIETHLFLIDNYYIVTDVEICDNETYFAGGANQNTTGVYFDSLLAVGGCDSIIQTNLTVFPTYALNTVVHICEGESHFAGGAFQTEPGTYIDAFTTAHGCDSVFTTELVVHVAEFTTRDVQRCTGDSFFVAGFWQFTDGVYTEVLQNIGGCDSTVETTLSFVSEIFVELTPVICEGENFFAGGAQQTTSGVYYDSTLSVGGCDSITETTLNVVSVNIVAQPDTATVMRGTPVNIVVTGGGGSLTYVWSPIDGLSCTDCSNLTVVPVNDVTYQVVVTDLIGCPDTATVVILVRDTLGPDSEFPLFYVPNAFTPNGDGENDDFRVIVSDYTSFRMIIFDRWGTKLFESQNPQTGWDGTFKGKLLNPGVYVYYIDVDFINNIIPPDYLIYTKGSVTLIR